MQWGALQLIITMEPEEKTAMIQGNHSTYYEYDSLGFLSKTTNSEFVEIKNYDFLGRVIEERTEDLSGSVYKKLQMSYDMNGNCVSLIKYKNSSDFAETKTIYNSENFPIAFIDALGNRTTIIYHHTDHLEKEIIDPKGRKQLEVYDPLNRLAALHKYSADGELLSHSSFNFDGRDNKILQLEKNLFEAQDLGIYSISSTYDSMSQKVLEIEQNEKTTKFTYKNDKLHQITKPNGVVFTHIYDSLGSLKELISSDGTINYRYTYDLNDNLIKVEDIIQNTTTERSYDTLDRLIFEKQATGFEISYKYDSQNRLKEMQFQGEKITYSYSPSSLISSSRYKDGNLLYTFTQQVDWCGKPIKQILPNGLNLSYDWDNLGRCVCITSQPFRQSFVYDPVSNMTSTSVTDPLGSYSAHFSYDDLDQITQETGPFDNHYAFDSLNNRKNKNGTTSSIDQLNRLTSEFYDKNGNCISKGHISYSYDALDRLIKVSSENDSITYAYDPFSRRMQSLDPDKLVHYLYQFDTEIGASVNGKTFEFKAIHGQFAPFAIELNEKIYSPIRNHRGDICLLLNDKCEPVSTYRYDAFGEFIFQGAIKSPWLFCGQRYESKSQTYHFINREYDPSTGRWLTPDPLGFTDGPNLYAYVHNNPLIYVDPHETVWLICLWSVPDVYRRS